MIFDFTILILIRTQNVSSESLWLTVTLWILIFFPDNNCSVFKKDNFSNSRTNGIKQTQKLHKIPKKWKFFWRIVSYENNEMQRLLPCWWKISQNSGHTVDFFVFKWCNLGYDTLYSMGQKRSQGTTSKENISICKKKTSIIKSLTSNSAATINNFLLNNLYCGIKSSFCKICRELLEWYTVWTSNNCSIAQ